MKLAVLGAGAWGTAISLSLARRHDVVLWTRDPSQAQALSTTRTNQRYLPDFPIPPEIAVTADLAQVLGHAQLLLVATSVAGLRPVLTQIAAAEQSLPIVWLCKGLEVETTLLPHQIAAQVLGAARSRGVLSGPSFAAEIARGLPAALTLASEDAQFATRTARALHNGPLRIYSSNDLIGVEVAGAIKNVMAIAAGISDGLGLGYNARAALITRGLAEITRLGLKLGGQLETFMGLAGAGDLILTCTGDLSRNRSVGLKLAQGVAIDDILRQLGHVAEGVYSARAVGRLAGQLNVDMPITRAICRVLDEKLSPQLAVQELLQRDPKPE